MACAVAGLLTRALGDGPFTIELFHAFILRLLIGNASFHALGDAVQDTLGEVKMGVAHTRRSSCALDPIEEFRAHCAQELTSKYDERVMAEGWIVALTRLRCARWSGNRGRWPRLVRLVLSHPVSELKISTSTSLREEG
jgi:hypothetical protein